MFSQKRLYIALIIVSTLVITYLHFSTGIEFHVLHSIHAELYLIPLLFGALLGLKGALLTYLFVCILYLPYIFMSRTDSLFLVDKILQLLFLGIFVVLAGFLVDRDRRQRLQLEKERYLASIGQVATTIVHDLKNPLVAILGFAKRIRDGKGDMQTSAQTIIDAAHDMQRIVYDVLDFAKPIQLTLREEDIRNIISRAFDSCRTKAENAEVSLSIDFPPDPMNFEMDAFKMERALVNIINNSIEASGKGQKVEISLTKHKDGIGIMIRDQGAGMDEETIKNIFTPFYTTKSKGTGLGLSISKKIIDAHKGVIRLKSTPGSGTEIVIEFLYGLKG